tara:strand:- start:133 stop:1263 length:1131 start_codon:yes stop_codon:yes gene_type:complete
MSPHITKHIWTLYVASLLAGLPSVAAAEQAKSFVVSWFTPAIYSQDDDCPGQNPSIDGIYRHAIQQLGVTPEEEEKLFAKYVGTTGGAEAGDIIINRGRINGKPVNAYANPLAAPDPNLFTVTGKLSFGFDLDGKSGPDSFEEAETHEQGIDNQFFRAVGCNTGMRAYYPNRPLSGGTFQWDNIRLTQPAWLVTIRGEDLTRNGPVTVIFDRALEATQWDALSKTRAHMTYRIDSNPRSHNEFKAYLKDGVVSTIEPGNFHMVSDPYYIHVFKFRDAQLRIKLLSNGNIDGFIGGYQPWIDPYQGLATGGLLLECCLGTDFIGMFYNLRKLADAYPDPETGENTHISTAFRIEGVPAYTITDDVTAESFARRVLED